jgi:hypothetical protein
MSELKKKKVRYPMKYYNIFTWIYLVLIKRRDMTLEDVYHYTISCADDAHLGSSMGSWWDVFDGVCWICSFVFGLILIGYILS